MASDVPEFKARRMFSIENRLSSARMISFSDGVVAIAITLLILPLASVDLPPSNEWPDGNPYRWIWEENQSLISSFLTSFFIIAIFWLVHHRITGYVERIDGTLVWANFFWLFGIVVLPFPGNMVAQTSGNSVPVMAGYIGTMVLISFCLTIMSLHIRRNPELLSPDVQMYSNKWSNVRAWAFTVYLTGLLVLCFVKLNWVSTATIGLFIVGILQARIPDERVLSDEELAKAEAEPADTDSADS